jgi:hypothetical protein
MKSRNPFVAATLGTLMAVSPASTATPTSTDREARAQQVSAQSEKRTPAPQTVQHVFRRQEDDLDDLVRPIRHRKGLDMPRHRSPGDRQKKRRKRERRTRGCGK